MYHQYKFNDFEFLEFQNKSKKLFEHISLSDLHLVKNEN